MWCICTPAYKSLGTSVSRLGAITWQLRVFGSGPPCARCSVGYLCLLKLVLNITFLFNVINDHYDIDISNKLIFCKDRSTGYNLRKNDTQHLVPNFIRTNGFKYSFFNRIVDETNSLTNYIRESNSIETFKKDVLSFIKDNYNIYFYTSIQFLYILIRGASLVWSISALLVVSFSTIFLL